MDIYRDIVIIGAGTAGLSAERSARHAGGETLLVDPGFSGTTCANVGCMPSKLLIAAGQAAYSVRQACQFGVSATPCVDGEAVMHRLRRERDHFAQTTRDEIAALPQGTTLRGKARFTGPNNLMLEDGTSIIAKAIVIATGARPAMPSDFVPLGDLALTNESLFELETLPETLAVIGAGPLGLELGQAMARLGVKVTLLDASTTLGGLFEKRIAGRLSEILAREMMLVQGSGSRPRGSRTRHRCAGAARSRVKACSMPSWWPQAAFRRLRSLTWNGQALRSIRMVYRVSIVTLCNAEQVRSSSPAMSMPITPCCTKPPHREPSQATMLLPIPMSCHVGGTSLSRSCSPIRPWP
jgi:dihydrolipoamide dehydrogenase